MSAKAIREVDGKRLLNQPLKASHFVSARVISIDENTRWSDVAAQHPWTKQEALVVKPDQLIKRRGKLGLVGVNLKLEAAEKWVGQRMNKNTNVRFEFFSTNHECIEEYYFSLLFLWNSIVLHRFYWFSLYMESRRAAAAVFFAIVRLSSFIAVNHRLSCDRSIDQ